VCSGAEGHARNDGWPAWAEKKDICCAWDWRRSRLEDPPQPTQPLASGVQERVESGLSRTGEKEIFTMSQCDECAWKCDFQRCHLEFLTLKAT